MIEFEIVSEIEHKGSIVSLCRIDFITSETDFPSVMIRRQFPIRLAFAMTINKAQGQSLRRTGINVSKKTRIRTWSVICGCIKSWPFKRN